MRRLRLAKLWKNPYTLYVLMILMVMYLLNQTDRFILGVCSEELSRDLQFGTQECLVNESAIGGNNVTCDTDCHSLKHFNECLSTDGECEWRYSGNGIEYQLLAGPIFMLVFTLSAIPLGLVAGYQRVNRKLVLGTGALLWSLTTLTTSFSQAFWTLAILRAGLGMFEAICTPFATAIIYDYFDESLRATALSVYQWGVYIGYSLAFLFDLLVVHIGWRWVYRIAAFPGVTVAMVLLVTVKEPARQVQKSSMVKGSNIKLAITSYCKPTILLLSVASGIRMGGGVVWAYNVRSYYDKYYCGDVAVGNYLSWIPLLGGITGATLGGYIADRVGKKHGHFGRLVVLITSQAVATPFAVGAVYLHPPYGFLSLLVTYIIGEMWIGVSLAIVTHVVPFEVVSISVAIYLFIINNIGSTLNLLVPPLTALTNLQLSLVILFAGAYLLAAILFSLTLLIHHCGNRYLHYSVQETSRLLSPDLEELPINDDVNNMESSFEELI